MEATIRKKTLGLIISQKCNLDCTYCYVDKKQDRVMELTTAKRIVADFLEKEKDADLIQIEFMGGEPLTAYPIIHDLCEWIWSVEYPKPVFCFATTNGTLLTEKCKEWFAKNKAKISLSLSFDGANAQNINRSNSLASVDLAFFRETWPDQPVKMTISEDSVPFLASDVIDLFERKIPFVANFEMGAVPWRSDSLNILSDQMEQIMYAGLQHPDWDLRTCFDIDIRTVGLHFPRGYKRCGIADSFYVVDMEEVKYPCQMMSSLALPSEHLEGVTDLDMFHRYDYAIAECQKCVLDNICPICYAMSYKRYGNPFQREVNICRIYRVMMKHYSGYLIRKLMSKQERTQEEQYLLYQAGSVLSRLGEYFLQ